MAKTIKTTLPDLLTRIIFSIITGLITAIIISYLTRSPVGILMGILVATAILWVIYEKDLKRRIRALYCGIKGYYFSFDEDEKVWGEIKESFCYLGISCSSIYDKFEHWVGQNSTNIRTVNFKFLLMNPNATSLKKQLCFRYNYDENNLTTNQQVSLNNEIAAKQKDIIAKTTQLKNLFDSHQITNYKIKYFDSFIPCWMYIIDNKKAYIGILQRSFDGLESKVAIAKKDEIYTNVFTLFWNIWQRMWQDAVDA